MSQENIEVAQRAIGAFNRSEVDAFAALTTPDFEWSPVIMLGRLEGRGKGSGVPVDSSLGMVFDFRGAAISRIRGFLDHGEALRAAGISD